MTIQQGIALMKANPGPGLTPVPANEELGGTRMIFVSVGGGSIYVQHPYSEFVETALEYAIGIAEIAEEAWRRLDAVKPRGSTIVD